MSTKARVPYLNGPSVVKFALKTRLAFLTLQVFSNVIIPDHVSDAFQSPLSSVFQTSNRSTALDKVVLFLLEGLNRWDAQYFLHIAHYGYTYENCLAFFPCFPLSVRYLSSLITKISFDSISVYPSYLLSAILLNTLTFTSSALVLFCLTRNIFQNHIFAYRCALLFCLSPASVFLVAPYTESSFSLFSFLAMYYFDKGQIIYSSFWIGLAISTRSNGLVLIGLVFFYFLQECLKLLNSLTLIHFCRLCTQVCLAGLIALFPFAAFQSHAYFRFCHQTDSTFSEEIISQARENGLVLAGSNFSLEWCNHSVPVSYSHVQSRYWSVGFLRYYQLKQIPNFLLASPILYLIFKYALTYTQRNLHNVWVLLLPKTKNARDGIYSPNCGVYVIHAFALAIFCVSFVHIQVSTRLLASSSPVLYWYLTYLTSDQSKKSSVAVWPDSSEAAVWCRAYCLSYIVFGFLLFSNHLPWT